jgi:hypothetical protein
MDAISFRKLAPVLFVKRIESCLDFWVRQLGFEKTVVVMEGREIGYAVLCRDNVELIIRRTHGPLASGAIHLELDDISPVLELAGQPDTCLEIVVPLSDTAYGASEIVVREPGGCLITFASPAPRLVSERAVSESAFTLN